MFAHARNRHVEHVREVWSSFARASSRRSAWLKSPRKWRGGRFTTTENGWSCWERKKREKGKKQALSSRGYKKRFPLDHTFLPFVVSQKIHTFPFKVAKSMFFPFYREKKFLKTASLGAKIFSKFFFCVDFFKGGGGPRR